MQNSAAESRADQQYKNDIAAREDQRAYDRDALVRLVADSEKAGFNPLTVLRNGGTSQFSSGAPLLSRQVPEDNMGSAVSKVGDFLANFDPFADDKREQESRLIESQIAALNAGGLSGVRRGHGNFASGDFDRSAPRKASALSADPSLGKARPFKANDAQVTNPWKYGEVNPHLADASNYEDRYGEVAGSGLGVVNLFGDAGTNLWNGARWLYDDKKGYRRAAQKLLDPFAGAFVPERIKRQSGNGGGGW